MQDTQSTAEAAVVEVEAQTALSSNSQSSLALSLLASAALAACGGGGGGGGSSSGANSSAASSASTPPLAAATDEEAARFLQQSQFASTPEDIAAVRATNYANYLQQQYAKPITKAWDFLENRNYGLDSTLNKYIYSTEIADCMAWGLLMGAPDAMRQRIALALSEYFVVSLGSMEIDWRAYAMAAYWDVLSQNAFGNFRDLLEAITLNAAMGYYLNTKGNQKEDSKGRVPDENYAREVMQLFTIGLYELNTDGSYKLDASGKKIETYTNDDVSQLARVFTGYDFDKNYSPSSANGLPFPGATYKVWAREYARQPMTLDDTKHSTLAATFLKTTVAANTPGKQALKTALDTLFNHSNVGPFFARQMIQRLVTSNPSAAYVSRVAQAFNNNGSGVRGDLKAVWNAILLDSEARASATLTTPSFGKLREPMLRLVQWSRSFGAVSKGNSWKIFNLSDASFGLGQNPLRSPSVFNFFRPGYVPPGTVMAQNGATAPEFQLISEITVSSYINFMQPVIKDGISTPSPDTYEILYTNYVRTDVVGNYSSLTALINNTAITDAEALRVAQSIVSKLNLTLTAGQLTTGTQTEITNALKTAMLQTGKRIVSTSTETLKRELVSAAILMVMACPDYLIQK